MNLSSLNASTILPFSPALGKQDQILRSLDADVADLRQLPKKLVDTIADYIFPDCRVEDPTSYCGLQMRKFLIKVRRIDYVRANRVELQRSFKNDSYETINKLMRLSLGCENRRAYESRISFIVNFKLIYPGYRRGCLPIIGSPTCVPTQATSILRDESNFFYRFRDALDNGLFIIHDTYAGSHRFDLLTDFDELVKSELAG